ncbi:hypothetical protein SAMN02983003_0596 [Devosia enhydra]|uniref:Uncharacterized protein n=1 Tax=Devosia enhydra TaxID=665118 RepID=A0A1K2HTQ8_9HYPH|nr:hypothetical protein [Devosia enhydra]SFZ81617.1 hypothetical protein SAMN02983003_0596 [Devosia enhydra]
MKDTVLTRIQLAEAAAASQKRNTFVIPEGHEAVRDSEGRATGETRPITTPPAPVPKARRKAKAKPDA